MPELVRNKARLVGEVLPIEPEAQEKRIRRGRPVVGLYVEVQRFQAGRRRSPAPGPPLHPGRLPFRRTKVKGLPSTGASAGQVSRARFQCHSKLAAVHGRERNGRGSSPSGKTRPEISGALFAWWC